ncbi:MAG: tetratricopeptide repeat protein [bacterium]|nr:tetratricopeptide repeat protein [Candidatus Sumerlaeota bacterium]
MNTCRVVVLGESAAQGDPDWTFGFSRILDVMLRDRYPSVRFEVINAAMVAINSHVIREIARDCARLKPDLFVICAGNNEVVGPYGPSSVAAPLLANPAMIRAQMALGATRTGQALRMLARPFTMRNSINQTPQGRESYIMNEMRSDDPKMSVVYENFSRNLRDILNTARTCNARVILCTVAANLKDSPPFGSLHRSDLNADDLRRWEAFYRQGISALRHDDYRTAIDCFRQAEQIDNQHALLAYYSGQCHLALNDTTTARLYFQAARNLDALHFGADNNINNIIRSARDLLSSNTGILTDAQALFDKETTAGIAGNELFLDHLHMNFSGNYMLARAVAEQTFKLMPDWVRKHDTGRGLPSEQDCANELAYTEWNKSRILRQICRRIRNLPFTVQPGNNERVQQLSRELDALAGKPQTPVMAQAATVYNDAIQRAGNDWVPRFNYAQLLYELGQFEEAAQQLDKVLTESPWNPAALTMLGENLFRLGSSDDAVNCLEQALRIDPRFVDAMNILALISAGRQDWSKASSLLRKALRTDPNFAKAHNNLGSILNMQGRADEAIKQYKRAIACDPDLPDAYANLAEAFLDQGLDPEALSPLSELARLRPNDADTRIRYAELLMKQNDVELATEQLLAAQKLQPDDSRIATLLRNKPAQTSSSLAAAETNRSADENPDDNWQ